MPDLKSMKFTPSSDNLTSEPQKERFPSIHLSKEQMEALGIGTGSALGTDMVLVANVRLSSLSIGERDFDNRAELDLREAAVQPVSRSDEEMGKSLFNTEG